MSAGQGAVARTDMMDDDNDYGKPIVHVEGIEKGREEDSSNTGHKALKEKEPEGYFHEGDAVKTTYTVEEDTPSLYQKLKGKFLAAEYQVRSMVADYTKKSNPHSGKDISVSTVQATHKPHVVAQSKKSVWSGKHDDSTGKGEMEEEVKRKEEAEDETACSDHLKGFSSAKGAFDSETTEDRKFRPGDELGTGYEESSEESVASPENSAADGSGTLPRQSESPFKQVKPKDESEVTLEELRASKLSENSSADDVKAPGMFMRVKEEVDALTDEVSEGLGLTTK